VLAQLPDGDVINVHSMFRFLDYRAFFASVPRRIPVVRTLHDMNFFTGGCHYDAGCGKYARGCGACPQLGSNDPQDLSRRIWLRKYAAVKNVAPDRLFLVTPSRWLAEEAKRSPFLKDFSVTVIPNGVDTEVFRPRDRGFAREVLGIAQHARVVLFVADSLNRPFKRFSLLVQAVNEMGNAADLLLLTVGRGKGDVPVRVAHRHLGHIGNARLLSLVYSAADVVAVPSSQDNCPLVVLEGLACGVPVVGSAVGGIAEIVRHGVTGLLVPPEDAGALRAALQALLDEPSRRAEMAIRCSQQALEEHSLRLQAQRYLALYERIWKQA
jgi:glycosyltransferase involved in cell wall biosynthesis